MTALLTYITALSILLLVAIWQMVKIFDLVPMLNVESNQRLQTIMTTDLNGYLMMFDSLAFIYIITIVSLF